MAARIGFNSISRWHREQIDLSLEQRGLVGAVPEGAGAPIGAIDMPDVPPTHRDEHPWDRVGVRRREEQVDVIGHQHIGVQVAPLPPQGLVQPAEIGVAVPVGEEAGAAVVAALHDRQRRPVEMEARTAGHVGSLAEIRAWPLSRNDLPV
jgi:hypothetical protein